jgi:uncharacterized protein
MAFQRRYPPSTNRACPIGWSLRSGAAVQAALFCICLAVAASVLVGPADAMRQDTLKLITAQGALVIDVEITESMEEKARGLMFRTRLPDNGGMLFSYDTAQEITMWMENTYIPLDMVFIRADGVVHRIEAWTEPFSRNIIASHGNVVACLELAGGAAQRFGLKAGDRVEYPLFGTSGTK